MTLMPLAPLLPVCCKHRQTVQTLQEHRNICQRPQIHTRLSPALCCFGLERALEQTETELGNIIRKHVVCFSHLGDAG